MEYALHSFLFSLLSTICAESKIFFSFLASTIITIEVNKTKNRKWNNAATIKLKLGLLRLVVLLWKKVAHAKHFNKLNIEDDQS